MWIGIGVVSFSAIYIFYLAYKILGGNINLINDYHINNIKDEDKNAYCKLFSLGLFLIAIGLLISGFFMYIENILGVLVSIFSAIFLGIFTINKAQKKYNGRWFS